MSIIHFEVIFIITISNLNLVLCSRPQDLQYLLRSTAGVHYSTTPVEHRYTGTVLSTVGTLLVRTVLVHYIPLPVGGSCSTLVVRGGYLISPLKIYDNLPVN